MKYNIGDKVKVKDTLRKCWQSNSQGKMDCYCSKKATIMEIIDGYYSLDIDKGEWSWTDDMLNDYIEESELTFKQLEKSPIEGIELNYSDSNEFEKSALRDGEIVYIEHRRLQNNDIPELIAWLQSVYNYCTELKNKVVEYVDFNTAKEHMKKGNKAMYDDNTYYIKDEEFYNEDYNNKCSFKLKTIESDKWILL